jgi:alpha-tubulin suppressor-like RCC1 family protein
MKNFFLLFFILFLIKFNLNWEAISSGFSFILTLNSKGEVYSFGENSVESNGDFLSSYKLMKVDNLVKVKNISAGGYHCLALTQKNELFSWGINNHRQVI